MSRRYSSILWTAGIVLGAICQPATSVLAQKAAPKATEAKNAGDPFATKVLPLLRQYCTKCHGGARPKGGVDLDKFKEAASAREHAQLWDKVAANLRAGDMPPKGKPRPTLDEIQIITAWTDDVVAQADCTKQKNPGRVTIRRLNRVEYKNTIRDLLGIDFKPADDFPTDDVGYGFDNIGDVLTLSPLLMERYLDAADKIVEQAFKDPQIRQRIMVQPKEKKQRRTSRIRDIIQNFGPRVYRRPVTNDEIERLGALVELAIQNGQDFPKGVQLAVKAMLVSPHFLFRIELDRSSDANGIYAISDYELASRLSYFLWSSMPDNELFKLAGAGTLRKNLEAQVRRMLKDPKAHALTENFAGQWLNLRILKEATPDPKRFPTFNENLRTAMRTETEMFFEAIVKEDRSVLDFLDADFSFVNEGLAKHYGIPGIKGKEFRRVELKGSERGGVITQASILTVTSNPTRTAPVKRGKWILENILNTPPPPPPPDAGELPEGDAELKGTLRQRLEMHRSKAICASCHQRMDPLGFALENFDAVGAWRTRDGKFPIDNTGTLPTGQSFVGAKGLRTVLKTKEADFRKCLTEKLLTYALGRGLELYDKCTVEEICKTVAGKQNRFSSMVVAIVKSDPFQMRKGRGKSGQ